MNEIRYKNRLSIKNRIGRALWLITSTLLIRPFGTKLFRKWRNFVLRLFGATIHSGAGIYSSVTIWAPWNLKLEENAWLGPNVKCYNPTIIVVGKNSTVSQDSYLCAASHNIYSHKHELITSPIMIEASAWIAAGAFIGPGVTIGEGAVVGATASVFKNVAPWTIVGGNPAKFIKERVIND